MQDQEKFTPEAIEYRRKVSRLLDVGNMPVALTRMSVAELREVVQFALSTARPYLSGNLQAMNVEQFMAALACARQEQHQIAAIFGAEWARNYTETEACEIETPWLEWR